MRWFELSFVGRRPWLWEALGRSYGRILRGRHALRSVELGITYGCPMSCPYCSAEGLMKERGEPLTLAEWAAVIDQTAALGALHYLLTGGEPLQAPELLPVVSEIRKRRRCVSVVTTGWPLDAPLARALSSAGLDAAEISLDAAEEGAHDAARNRPGAFDRAMRAAELFRGAGITVLFTHVTTRHSLASGEVGRIIDLARAADARVNLGFAGLAGGFDGAWDELLTDADWAQVDALLKRPGVRCCAQSSYRGDACTPAAEKINVTRYGDVTPCPLMPSLRFGNVRDAPITVLWERMRTLPELSAGQPRCLPAADRAFIERHIASAGPSA